MSRHISEKYEEELAHVQDLLMEMGGLVEQQVNQACESLINHDREAAKVVRSVESRVNQLEVTLDDQCISIIALRQPTARDLRVMMSIMKAVTDLERIGDEADRIAKMALSVADLPIPANQYADFRTIYADLVPILNGALDAFARRDTALALKVIAQDKKVDLGYAELVSKSVGDIRANPDDVEHSMNLIWAARALERIGDHAKNISEYVVYQVEGEDVRHQNKGRETRLKGRAFSFAVKSLQLRCKEPSVSCEQPRPAFGNRRDTFFVVCRPGKPCLLSIFMIGLFFYRLRKPCPESRSH